MINNRLFLDIHAIQTVPPSNINRDDTGSPKTAQYGGVRRSRVSSQAWKKAIRDYFHANSADQNVGVRTLEIVKYVAEKMLVLDNSLSLETAMEKTEKMLNCTKIKTKDGRAKALFFLGDTQATALAKAALDDIDNKDTVNNILKSNPAVDIALFGRMVADDPSLNEDASSQVAHAISTHAVDTEFDFYTAVDDLSPDDNAGAGMLGTIEFNASTLYRYCNVAIHELLNQLSDKVATIQAVKLFIEAFAKSLPTGKINTFANHSLPSLILVTLRRDRPVNLVTAFEEPVRSSNGFIKKSIEKLVTEFVQAKKFVDEPILTLHLTMDGGHIEAAGKSVETLNILLDEISKELAIILPADTGGPV